MADVVFSFDDEGRLQRLPGLARSTKNPGFSRQLLSAPLHDQKKEFENSLVPPTPPLPLTTEASEDELIARQKGDYRLYFYYLGSAKGFALAMFLVAVALAAAGERMPRKLGCQWFTSKLLTMVQKSICESGCRVRRTIKAILKDMRYSVPHTLGSPSLIQCKPHSCSVYRLWNSYR